MATAEPGHEELEPDAQTEGEPAVAPEEADTTTPSEGAPDADGPSDDEAAEADGTGEEDADGASGAGREDAPSPPDSESDMEVKTKGLERASKNYGNKIAAVLGDDWLGLQPCPLCSAKFPGLLTPAPVTDDVVAAVRPLIGLPDFSNFRQDGHARTCDQCDGLGRTLTGSKVPQYATIQCADCNGTGFRSPLDAHHSPPANGTTYVAPPPTHTEDEPPPMMPDASLEALEAMVNAARAARGLAAQNQ